MRPRSGRARRSRTRIRRTGARRDANDRIRLLEGTATSRPYSSVRPVLMGRRGVGWEPCLEGRLRAAAAPSPEVRRPRPPSRPTRVDRDPGPRSMGPRQAGPRRQRRNVRSGEGSRLRGEESRREIRICSTSGARMRENSPTLAKGNGGKWTSSRSSRRAPSSFSARRSHSSSSRSSSWFEYGDSETTSRRSPATTASACGTASAASPGLLAIALIVWQALRLANIELEIGVTPAMITAALAALMLIFTFIRWIDAIHARAYRPDDLGVARPRTRDRARGRRLDEHAGRRRGPRRHQVLRRRRHGSCQGSGRPRRQAGRRRSRAADAPAAAPAPPPAPVETPADIPAEPPSEPIEPDDAPRAS